MIEGDRDFGYDLSCDVCGEIIEDFDNFYDAVEYKKDNGWSSRKTLYGDWEDVCPDCLEKVRRGN